MKCFKALATYGPVAGNYIEHLYKAQSKDNARKMFIGKLKRECLWLWEEYIGEANIEIQEIRCKNETQKQKRTSETSQ